MKLYGHDEAEKGVRRGSSLSFLLLEFVNTSWQSRHNRLARCRDGTRSSFSYSRICSAPHSRKHRRPSGRWMLCSPPDLFFFFVSLNRPQHHHVGSRVGRKSAWLSTSFYFFSSFVVSSFSHPLGAQVPHLIPSPGKQSRQGRPSHDQLAIVAGVPSIMKIYPLNKSFRVDTARAMAVELGCSWSTFFFNPLVAISPQQAASSGLVLSLYTYLTLRQDLVLHPPKGSAAFSFLSRSGEFICVSLHREMNVDARAVDHQRGLFSAHHLLIKPRIKLGKVMAKYMPCTDCVLQDR